MSFRIRGRRFLITWAQAEGEHLSIFELLDNYAEVRRCIIARERHQDGEPHFHAYVEFVQPLDRSLTTQLDWEGKHPNVKPKRTKKEQQSAANYVRKDNDWLEYGEWDDEDNSENTLLELVGECGDYGEVLNLCHRDGIPFALANAAYKYMNDSRPKTWVDGEENDGTVNSQQLLDLVFELGNPPRSMVIIGHTGLGKTTWAIRNLPRPMLYVRHVEDLKHFRHGYHAAILFDDCQFQHSPRQQQLGIVDIQQTVTIHIRHTVVTLPPKVPRMFLCNPGKEAVDLHDEAIARRCNVIYL